jgi:hypothetical protein
LIEQQIEHQQRTNELLTALLEAFKNAPPPVVQVTTQIPEKQHYEPTETTITLGNFGNSQSSQPQETQKPSPKLEYAIQWLKAHPEDMLVPGRELEARVTMNGEKISYKWWNEAKKKAAL